MRLAEIATYVNEKISSSNIDLNQYVTTDSLLQDKRGRECAQNLPPVTTNLIHYQPGDVLVANIRPYLKKLWFADCEGGASSDVLVIRAKNANDTTFVYALLMQDSFYDYAMKGAKGSKMPRGDKDQIMRYEIPTFSLELRKNIGKFITDIESKIAVNRQINDNLEAMAKQLYDYWFVQFDFPDEEGKPYKLNGGKMVWNDKLKREIPDGWSAKSIFDEMSVQYGFPFSTDDFTEEVTNIPVVRIRDILDNTISAYSHEETDDKYRLNEADLLIGMDGNFHMNYWIDNIAYLNQRSVRLRSKQNSNVSIVQARYDIEPYIKAKEQRAKGSTVGHLSDKDLKELKVVVCPNRRMRDALDSLLYRIIANRKENLCLTKQRDELLPLLMNGQVSVNYHLSHD
jgi:type I restriction enzyme S subunit